MTSNEWWEDICDYDELISWCRDHELCEDYIENIISDDEYDEYVNGDISNYYYGWRDLRDALCGLPGGYDWYRVDGMFDYVGLDDSDFEDIKQDVCSHLEDIGFFDDEDDGDDAVYENAEHDAAEEEPPEPDDQDWEIDELDNDLLSSMIGDIRIEEPQEEYIPETEPVPIIPADEYGDEAFDEVIERILAGVSSPGEAVA